jgi:hypothetical protein
MTELTDLISPEEAHEYLATKVFMDFDASKQKTIQKSLDAFRDEQLIPALMTIAVEKVPALTDNGDQLQKIGHAIWQNVMISMVMYSNKLPPAGDPDRDAKALDAMNEITVAMVDGLEVGVSAGPRA